VRTVRVTISPDNVPSYRLASQYGFAEVGEQWDDEDGLEIIYELKRLALAESAQCERGLGPVGQQRHEPGQAVNIS
jgi:L-amino acid N-acyltransferase YncA